MAIGDITRINTNISAFKALNSLSSVNAQLVNSQLKLATGKRINSAADDNSGFVISRKLESRTRGLNAALNNAADAKSVLAVAEGGAENISQILLTMKEKATQAANDTLGSDERTALQTQVTQLMSEINDIVSETTFNGIGLIDGTFTNKNFQTGEGVTDGLTVSISQAVTSGALGIRGLNLTTGASTATAAIASIDAAISTVSSVLQNIGATVNRLDVKESTLSVAITNTEASASRIRDADMAREQLNATRLQILQQTSTAQLAQANAAPQSVLSLF